MGCAIITNWQARPLQCLQDLPEKARANFDYLEEGEEYSPRFACYRGQWVDCIDTQRIEPDNGRAHPMGWAMHVHPGSPLAHFDSVITDSHFSGMLFRFSDDFESVTIARFHS